MEFLIYFYRNFYRELHVFFNEKNFIVIKKFSWVNQLFGKTLGIILNRNFKYLSIGRFLLSSNWI